LVECLDKGNAHDSSLLPLPLPIGVLDSLDINEVAVLGTLPQGLDVLKPSPMQSEARPRQQLQKGTGNGHKHQQVKATLTQWHRERRSCDRCFCH